MQQETSLVNSDVPIRDFATYLILKLEVYQHHNVTKKKSAANTNVSTDTKH